MNINRFVPLGLKIWSVFGKRQQLIKRSKIRQFPNYNDVKMRLYYVGLAFIWPAKKAKEVSEVKEKLNDVSVADDLFESGHYEECYELLNNSEDQSVETKWRLCRVLYNMAKEPKCDKAKKRDYIESAYTVISQQLTIPANWENFAVQKWYALALDAKSSCDGIKERIKQLENVKKHMDLAVTFNPNDATTLHMLGEWCYQISDMPWHQRKLAETFFASPPRSTYEDALEYFLKAETVEPRFYSLNLLRIGNCYLKLNKADQAKYYLKLAASYPAKSNDDHKANTEATELLKSLK